MSAELDLAEQALHRGQPEQAEKMARGALRLAAGDPARCWQLLASSLLAQARPEEARMAFAQLAELQPHEPAHWLNLGNCNLECGDGETACAAFEQARATGADDVAYLLGHGLALLACGRFLQAQPLLLRAWRQEPQAADTCLAYAQCLAELERFDEIGACIGQLSPGALSPAQRQALAWLLAQAGEDVRALALYRELLAEDVAAIEPRLQLVLLLERLNRVADAAALLCQEPLASAPLDAMKALALGRVCRREGRHREARDWLRQGGRLAGCSAIGAQLQFELAKVHDALADADAAMASLAQAHRLAGEAFAERSPDPQAQASLLWLRQGLSASAPGRWQRPFADGLPPDPVFLVGFPRSGTTLLETVLGNHSRLDVLDERPALEAAIARLRQRPDWRDDDLLAMLDRLDADALHAARVHYWEQVARYLRPAGRLVDKYPLSLTRVPYVARLFPHARWLLLLRHPCDCVLSCHMQAFGLNGGALAFATLQSTAQTYARVMAYWETQRRHVQAPVHAIRYEDMVEDLRSQLDPAMAFLGLQWEPAQADFAAAAAARERRINTPSYAQVTRPLHAGAVGRWRRYRAHFPESALAVLRPWLERYGYALE